jgi:hypothetical protein
MQIHMLPAPNCTVPDLCEAVVAVPNRSTWDQDTKQRTDIVGSDDELEQISPGEMLRRLLLRDLERWRG